MTFSSPVGATGMFEFVFEFTSALATGTYTSSATAGSCGEVLFEEASGGTSHAYTSTSAYRCTQPAGTAVGAWTLVITSLEVPCGASTTGSRVAHGTVTATLNDTSVPPNTGTMSLTF